MKSQKVLRQCLLLELYRLSRGDLTRDVGVDELADTLKKAEKALSPDRPTENAETLVMRAVNHLAEKSWVKVDHNPLHHSPVVKMTVQGVEEAERMEEAFERWSSEHPKLFAALVAIITGVTDDCCYPGAARLEEVIPQKTGGG